MIIRASVFFYFDTQTISIIPDVHKINVTDNKYYCSYDDKKLIYMRETGVAYILWCACFLGVCGVQRFYCGKYISGIIYLFTLGLFGLGQLVDLALIPGMVEDKNLKYKLLHGSPNVNTNNSQSVVINLGEQVASFISSAQSTANQKSDIQIILQLAKDNGGSVSISDCVLATGKPVIEVKNTLASMCTDGLLEVGNRPDTGAIVYKII